MCDDSIWIQKLETTGRSNIYWRFESREANAEAAGKQSSSGEEDDELKEKRPSQIDHLQGEKNKQEVEPVTGFNLWK